MPIVIAKSNILAKLHLILYNQGGNCSFDGDIKFKGGQGGGAEIKK